MGATSPAFARTSESISLSGCCDPLWNSAGKVGDRLFAGTEPLAAFGASDVLMAPAFSSYRYEITRASGGCFVPLREPSNEFSPGLSMPSSLAYTADSVSITNSSSLPWNSAGRIGDGLIFKTEPLSVFGVSSFFTSPSCCANELGVARASTDYSIATIGRDSGALLRPSAFPVLARVSESISIANPSDLPWNFASKVGVSLFAENEPLSAFGVSGVLTSQAVGARGIGFANESSDYSIAALGYAHGSLPWLSTSSVSARASDFVSITNPSGLRWDHTCKICDSVFTDIERLSSIGASSVLLSSPQSTYGLGIASGSLYAVNSAIALLGLGSSCSYSETSISEFTAFIDRLSSLDQRFAEMFCGAIEAMQGKSAERIRQAAHSARELLLQVLHQLAPKHSFDPDDIKIRGHQGRPTLKMRVEKACSQRVSHSACYDLQDEVEAIYGGLCRLAHYHKKMDQSQAPVFLSLLHRLERFFSKLL